MSAAKVYPKEGSLFTDEIVDWAMKVFKGEVQEEEVEVQAVVDTEIVKKVEKYIGELLTVETFNQEVMSDGHDAAVLLIGSHEKSTVQEKFVDAFIDCKRRFKLMRHRGIRWYAADGNAHLKINFGTTYGSLPQLLFYPAFHKGTTVQKYTGDIDSIKMAKFLHKKADIKFEWRAKFFRPKEKQRDGPFIDMAFDEKGNAVNDPSQMREVQAKQDREEREKADYIRYLES